MIVYVYNSLPQYIGENFYGNYACDLAVRFDKLLKSRSIPDAEGVSMPTKFMTVIYLLLLTACAAHNNILDEFEEVPASTTLAAPEPRTSSAANSEVIAHGKYLVELLGCGSCHTDGALIGLPNESLALAGSHIGIAHSNPLENKYPGVVFPPNLTPDAKTGLGRWSDGQIKAAIRGELGRHGLPNLTVMPVAAYARVKDDDLTALIAYLRHLIPVHNEIPKEVSEGKKTQDMYVHFGVYRSREK